MSDLGSSMQGDRGKPTDCFTGTWGQVQVLNVLCTMGIVRRLAIWELTSTSQRLDQKIKKEKSMAMLLYGFTVSVVGAALRLGLIQHLESQKIIHDVKSTITQTIKNNEDKSVFDMWQFTPQLDIIQMSHEKMDSKMFIT